MRLETMEQRTEKERVGKGRDRKREKDGNGRTGKGKGREQEIRQRHRPRRQRPRACRGPRSLQNGQPYDAKTDMYGLGCLGYEMASLE
jgi:hypothetical protein